MMVTPGIGVRSGPSAAASGEAPAPPAVPVVPATPVVPALPVVPAAPVVPAPPPLPADDLHPSATVPNDSESSAAMVLLGNMGSPYRWSLAARAAQAGLRLHRRGIVG